MTVNIVVPDLGESILDATIGHWLKKEGEAVIAGEPLVELETDKVNLVVSAHQAGVLSKITRQEGEDVKVGDPIGTIDESTQEVVDQVPVTSDKAAANNNQSSVTNEQKTVTSKGSTVISEKTTADGEQSLKTKKEGAGVTPVAERVARELGVDASRVSGSGPGGRVTRGDIEKASQQASSEAPAVKTGPAGRAGETKPVQVAPPEGGQPPAQKPQERAPGTVITGKINLPLPPMETGRRSEERIKMSRRRRTIAQRLVEVQQVAAMLTTFNEADMTRVMDLRSRRNPDFQTRYGVKLGITSFFVKAAIGALKAFPLLNAEVEGDEFVVKHYYDIGVAVGSPEGLVVPVLRDADRLSFVEIEKQITGFVKRTDEGKLTLEDLRGGTFTITNGGVFGSLMSTPILTPPQVGILGLHKIEKRPVAVDDQVVIRPMMYLALSYDHRIVDGREAVQFLVKVKELIEDPESLLIEG